LSPADDILIRIERPRRGQRGAARGVRALQKDRRGIIASGARQPVGRGIGPALEARDVLSVLQNRPGASKALKERACTLAGALLELGCVAAEGEGVRLATATVEDGRARQKFQRICEAQGGMRVPPVATQRHPLAAAMTGAIVSIDNRRIARLAKLAGAPEARAAGVDLHVQLGDRVAAGQPVCAVHADSPGELHYALDYAAANPDIIGISPE
jgi:thymidine phosphorylase